MDSTRSQIFLFFAAVICMAAAVGIHDSVFNNFLSDTFDLSADARGRLEFPRELPGLLVVLVAGALSTLAITHVGVVGTLIYAAGLVGFAFLGSRYVLMVLMMMVASTGMHLLMPVGSSLALGLSDASNRGRRLGQVGAVGTTGTVLGTGLVWLLFDKSAPQYRTAFLCSAVLGVGAGTAYMLMRVPHLHRARSRLVFRKRYALYYVLELLFGARKQIFFTFGPWVLIKVYEQPATSIAGLFTIAALIGIVFKPLTGIAIDHFGERRVMIADGVLLACVCLGYGFALHLTDDSNKARLLACICFVADNLLFALGSGRAVYLSRLTNSPKEITSTLAMGVSINHVVSMTIPAVAGAIWIGWGYERVFVAAAVLALAISVVSSRVPKAAA